MKKISTFTTINLTNMFIKIYGFNIKPIAKFEICAEFLIMALIKKTEQTRKLYNLVSEHSKEMENTYFENSWKFLVKTVICLIENYIKLIIFNEKNYTSPCIIAEDWIIKNIPVFIKLFEKEMKNKKDTKLVTNIIIKFDLFFSTCKVSIDLCRKEREKLKRKNKYLVNSFLKKCQAEIKKRK